VIRDQVITSLYEQAERPPVIEGEPDIHISRFYNALAQHLTHDSETATALERAVEIKRLSQPCTAEYIGHFMFRLCQMKWLSDPEYVFQDPETWGQRIEELFSNPSERRAYFDNMVMWNVGSDVETRIAGPKLAAHFFMPEDRLKEGVDFLNVGSSRNHALVMLAANLTLLQVIVYEGEAQRPDKQLSQTIQVTLDRPVTLREGVGVDLWHLRDSSWSEFAQACRYGPLELQDPQKRNLYPLLEAMRDADPRLSHLTTDYGNYRDLVYVDSEQLARLDAENSFDLVAFSTCWYQNYPQKRRRMFERASHAVREDGLIVVQDFCQRNPTESDAIHPADQLDMLDDWQAQPFLYKTYVYEMRHPERGFQLLGAWNNSRCERLRIATPIVKRFMPKLGAVTA
jgi:hypothetical protein